jgi:hypothetical protein
MDMGPRGALAAAGIALARRPGQPGERAALRRPGGIRALRPHAHGGARPGSGRLRLSGTFDPQRLAHFRSALPKVLPVRLKQNGDLTEIVEATDTRTTAVGTAAARWPHRCGTGAAWAVSLRSQALPAHF